MKDVGIERQRNGPTERTEDKLCGFFCNQKTILLWVYSIWSLQQRPFSSRSAKFELIFIDAVHSSVWIKLYFYKFECIWAKSCNIWIKFFNYEAAGHDLTVFVSSNIIFEIQLSSNFVVYLNRIHWFELCLWPFILYFSLWFFQLVITEDEFICIYQTFDNGIEKGGEYE